MREGLSNRAATVAVAAAGLLCVLLLGSDLPDWLRAALGLPAALLIGGYLISAALFPGVSLRTADRAVTTIAFSLAVLVLGGLVLHWLWDLDSDSVRALLAAAIILAGGVAAARSRPAPAPADRRAAVRIPLSSAAVIVGAVGIAAAAIAISVDSARDARGSTHFTSVGFVATGGQLEPATPRVTVTNETGASAGYEVRSEDPRTNRTLESVEVQLDDGDAWTGSFDAAATGVGIRIAVYREGALVRQLRARPGP